MFRFKQFEVRDELSAMKVGTDGVLLGAWASVEGSRRILDVGTGTGLIALMVAQRSPEARVVAIDICSDAVAEASLNIERSPWSGRIEAHVADVREYESLEKYDHIVSNPPYFVEGNASPDVARATARHTATLGFGDLVATAERVLEDGGKLSVVLPVEAAAALRREAFGRLWLSRQLDVASREGDAPRRVLMEFCRVAEPLMPKVESIAIHDREGGYSHKYRQLTEEFYLKF